MGKIPMVYSGDTVSFFINGVPYQVDSSMPGFEPVKEELKTAEPDIEKLIALTQPIQAIRVAVETAEAVGPDYLPKGTVSVTNSSISYNGEVIHGVLVDRILDLLSQGFDIMPMVRFLENLYMNPADFARDELYLWLETSNLPITEDGFFLAYKNVNADFTSIHGGVVKNDPGTVVSMPQQGGGRPEPHLLRRSALLFGVLPPELLVGLRRQDRSAEDQPGRRGLDPVRLQQRQGPCVAVRGALGR